MDMAEPNQAMAHTRCITFNAFIPFVDSFFIIYLLYRLLFLLYVFFLLHVLASAVQN